MAAFLTILVEQPLLLLFVVAALGYPAGQLRIGGTSLGVAAVLFVGLAVGALDSRLELPEFAYVFGLVVFVYSVGLTSAAGLVASFRRGSRDVALAVAVLAGAALLTAVAARLMALTPAVAAGVYAGALTNTPALAAVLEHAAARGIGAADGAVAEPIIGYSLSYPVGVIGMLAALAVARRWWQISETGERARLADAGIVRAQPVTRSVRITRAGGDIPLERLRQEHGWPVVFGRIRRGAETHVVTAATAARVGDIVTVVGDEGDIARATAYLGEPSDESIEWDRSTLDYRRVFVSSRDVAGRRLGDLDLPGRFGAVVTRVRRGDVEMLASDDLVLELGDRVRVVTDRARLDDVSRYFGDSYRAVSELDILAFTVGPALGLLLGLLPVPLPGGFEFRLGVAGGPLLVALVLGYLERTGPVVWVLPYSANLTLRQVGLVLFLAAIGTRAGWEFRTLLTSGGGLGIALAGAAVTFATALVTLWCGYRLLRLPFGLVGGMLAAVQTQPAVLGFAVQQAGSDVPNLAYARIYPVALVAKIILAQLLFEAL